MRRQYYLQGSASVCRGPDQRVIVDFSDSSIEDWCIELALLRYGLCSSLCVRSSSTNASFSVRIDIGPQVEVSKRALAVWQGNQLKLTLTETELDCWLMFFLGYVRDGFAAVDHIDVEALPKAAGDKDAFITLKVGRSQPPLPDAEARRRLGLS